MAYLSVHRYPFYPGTGGLDETGSGRGLGLTVNVPLPAGAGDEEYAGGFEAAIEGLLRLFRPDLVLVSTGFDAHQRDPLGGMRVSAEGYARLTRALPRRPTSSPGGASLRSWKGDTTRPARPGGPSPTPASWPRTANPLIDRALGRS